MLVPARWFAALPLVFAFGCSSSAAQPLPDDVGLGPAPNDGGSEAGSNEKDAGLRFGPGTQLDSSLSWEGYAKGQSSPSTIRLADFHDADGSKGINALLLTQESFTCDFSDEATRELGARAAGWEADGIEILQLVVYDYGDEPATIETAAEWKDHFQTTWNVGADPDFTFHEIGSNPLPIQIVVDPRTLTVVARANANDHRMLTELEKLAAKNKQ